MSAPRADVVEGCGKGFESEPLGIDVGFHEQVPCGDRIKRRPSGLEVREQGTADQIGDLALAGAAASHQPPLPTVPPTASRIGFLRLRIPPARKDMRASIDDLGIAVPKPSQDAPADRSETEVDPEDDRAWLAPRKSVANRGGCLGLGVLS